MAEADFTELTGSLSPGDVVSAATAGFLPPNGGEDFVYGFNSLTGSSGAAGFFTNLVNFAPMSKGGRITGAVQRAVSIGDQNFAPMLFIGLQGVNTSDDGYLIGLSDENPGRIVVRKGPPTGGLPASALGTDGILARGSIGHLPGTWVQVRLDMVVNANGDVVLLAFENDLDTNPVSGPVWTEIPGMSFTPAPATGRVFIDDAIGVNSGSVPFLDGRAGYVFQTADVGRRGLFDHITISRQL